jgi:hypothetical protein
MVDQSAIANGFHEMSLQLIESSMTAWPEDPLMPLALAAVKKLSGPEAMELFTKHFGAHVDGLSRKDETVLFEAAEHEALVALNIKGKYVAANANTRETIWTYIGHLTRFVSMNKMYKHIPKQVLGAVNEAAEKLKKQLDEGSLDAASINPFELGQSVMSQFKQEDIDKMMKELSSNPEVMSSMMSQMTSMMGSGDVPNIDVSSLMKR